MTLGILTLSITDEQLTQYADLIYRKTGNRVSAKKKTLLSNRLRRRLRETGHSDFDVYLKHLTLLPDSDPEWDAFLQEITTHETYLFRDQCNWDWLAQDFLSQAAADAAAGRRRKTLKFWSAASSTGDEAYTIACCVANKLPNFKQWKIDIFGTDIGASAVKEAQAGMFRERALRLVPDGLRRSYFESTSEPGLFKARPALAQLTRFRQHNLLQPCPEKNFDVVFLKNVLIYFDAESKQRVVRNVMAAMTPGGYLVAGAAEGIFEYVRQLERVNAWLFRMPTGEKAAT